MDPQHFNADPDPDPVLYQIYVNLRPMVYLPWLQFEPPRIHCEPLKLLNFDFIADPDRDLDPHGHQTAQ